MYQIFIPNVVGANVENLRKVGLGDLLASHDDNPDNTEILKGPNGGHGQLWGWANSQVVLSYDERTHNAVPCVADPVLKLPAGRFWWIFPKDSEVDEKVLRRKWTFSGWLTVLGDRKEWLIPNVLDFPESFGFAENGEVIKETKQQFRPFVDDAEWALDQVISPPAERDWRRELDVAVRFISANYRVNRELVLRWGLVDPQNVADVLVRCVDRDRLKALIDTLKNQDAGPATPDGSDAIVS